MCIYKSLIHKNEAWRIMKSEHFTIFLKSRHFLIGLLFLRVQQWSRRWKLFKSKAVSSKGHRNTETVILRGFKFFALPVSDSRKARTFSQDLFYPLYRVWIFVPVHGLLEYPRKSRFRHILGRWRSILWRFSTILRFGATGPDLPAFLLYLRPAFFEAQLLS